MQTVHRHLSVVRKCNLSTVKIKKCPPPCIHSKIVLFVHRRVSNSKMELFVHRRVSNSKMELVRITFLKQLGSNKYNADFGGRQNIANILF